MQKMQMMLWCVNTMFSGENLDCISSDTSLGFLLWCRCRCRCGYCRRRLCCYRSSWGSNCCRRCRWAWSRSCCAHRLFLIRNCDGLLRIEFDVAVRISNQSGQHRFYLRCRATIKGRLCNAACMLSHTFSWAVPLASIGIMTFKALAT